MYIYIYIYISKSSIWPMSKCGIFQTVADVKMYRKFCHLNSYRPNASYIRQRSGTALVQVMACRLIGLLSASMLAYCQLNSWEKISVKLESELYHFQSRKFIWKCRLPNWRLFCPGGDELKESTVVGNPRWKLANTEPTSATNCGLDIGSHWNLKAVDI